MRMNEAEVAELAYAADLKSADRKILRVRVPLSVLYGTIAQLAVQIICNDQVAGSSPVGAFRRAAFLIPCNSIGRVVGC